MARADRLGAETLDTVIGALEAQIHTLAHTILVMIYHLLTRHESYRDLGAKLL